MSVVGFDIGNYKSSVGIARAGGIEIVANEYSDRITPTYISFTNNERHQGHSAKQQEVTNHQNTITGFKRLLARKPTDQQVQNEKNFHPLRINQSNSDKVLVDLDYLNETRSFTPEQLVGIFLTKLKSIGEMNLNTKVTDCVLSVPSYFTDAERRALLDATQIAGLNCLKLMNETTAVALTYGLYHTDLPDVNDKPHIAIFVDMGYTSLQASAVAFHKGKLRILASTFDNNLGGRDFDKVLMDYFRKEFQDKYKIDAYSNVRARLRLRTECEKIKKLMSTNASSIPLNIECFMNDIDVSARIKRDDFEQLADSLLVRVRKVIQDLLNDANLKPEDISIAEVVGGSTRVPAVKKIIQETFQKEISTTLNADEACARGCTIMCAILSPNFKVKEFKIEDCQLFPITLSWKGAETDDNELEVFPKFEKIPLSKLLTIYKRESFEIEARYRFPNNIPYNEARIGKFYIGNVTPNQQGENSEVKLKARITKNGIFEISSPQMIETFEVEVPVQEQQAEQTAKPTEQTERQTSEQSASEDATMADEQASNDASQLPKMVKKKKTKAIDLALTARVPQLSKQELNELVEQELAMIQQDRKERERSEAKNSVEEYIYEIRGKLSEQYEHFITEQNKNTFMALLDETENWLYSDEAENQEKSVYVERLQSLKNFGEPVRKRFKESQERPAALEEFGRSLQLIKKAIDLYHNKDEKYSHLEKADIEKCSKYWEEKQRWFEEKSFLLSKMKPIDDPAVLTSQIRDEVNSLNKDCWSILNKPKPKVEPPKANPEPAKPEQAETNGEKQEQQKPMDLD
ncbi:unnamed protein product [Brachionus calyciflorus]|uniref:Uncharacterized protein n=1 Tax=Brachionus calyciflorus TaxID=104777 RepID=A0A813Z5K7_9BILA|nr:unnamed protein product [Brachionus calyciflorus]